MGKGNLNCHWHHIRFRLFNGSDYDHTEFRNRIVCGDSLLHYMIALELIDPILVKYKKSIKHWRIHRAQTYYFDGVIEPQHNFTLKLFCTSNLFKKYIRPDVENDPLTYQLTREELLNSIQFSRTDGDSAKDDHDISWPMMIKKVWPIFIQGTSEAWLAMIKDALETIKVENKRAEKRLEQAIWGRLLVYKEVADLVSDTYQNRGFHPFFHHVNAIFGYKWLPINLSHDRISLSGRCIHLRKKEFRLPKNMELYVKI